MTGRSSPLTARDPETISPVRTLGRWMLLPVTLPLTMMSAGAGLVSRLLTDAGAPVAGQPPVHPPAPRTSAPALGRGLRRDGAGTRSDDVVVTPDSAGDVVGEPAIYVKEDPPMNSCCDNDLSGCDLKVIQYTIVTADPDPDIDDTDRILAGPEVIATSDDLDDSSFTAWVIARYLQGNGKGNGKGGEKEKHLEHKAKQYLRVCYQVMCRLDVPCVNYQSQQAHQLSRIARVLEGQYGNQTALTKGKSGK